MDHNRITRAWLKSYFNGNSIHNSWLKTQNVRDRTGMYVPTPTAKAIDFIWGLFDNVYSKLSNAHKGVSDINNICCGNMDLVGNKRIILKKEDIINISNIKNQFRLEICERIKNMGYINETHIIMFLAQHVDHCSKNSPISSCWSYPLNADDEWGLWWK